jgi:murein DD-endopeptidase MepM/ murein hydrolase activator NlpD
VNMSSEVADGFNPPLPGPAERDGVARFERRYRRSSSLLWLNPFQIAQVVRQILGEEQALSRYADQPPGPDTFHQQVTYSLPFGGEWLVFNGGITEATSHSWDLLGQRFAYDFVVADADGRRHGGPGTSVGDYYDYGQPILSPADGEVVYVQDGIRDAPRVGTGWIDWRCRDFRGNGVVVRHHATEYSYVAHLQRGSILVRPGQEVKRGQPLGLCGNSGHSTEPHLHFQIQDQASFFGAMSLPVAFTSCTIDGAFSDRPAYLSRGMRVRTGEGGR